MLTCSMTGSGLLVTSSENKPSSAPSRTYCTVAGRETIGEMQEERERERERDGSHLVTGCVHEAAQFKCSGHPLNIFEK